MNTDLFTIYDHMSQDPVIDWINNMGTEENSEKSYFSILRFLMEKRMSLKTYFVVQMIGNDNAKLRELSQKAVLNDFEKACLAHDLEILLELISIKEEDLAEDAGDKQGLLISFRKNVEEDCPQVVREYIAFLDSCDVSLVENKDVEGLHDLLKRWQVGEFVFNEGFYVHTTNDGFTLEGVEHLSDVSWDQIYLYESQKDALYQNTKAFAEGKTAQNALLVGASGTGKSTSVKTVAGMFVNQNVRLIQMQKGQLRQLPKVLKKIKETGFKCILFIDDLSFEANEDEYKFLKSFIEGSISSSLSNVVFYVTSNRRHLIKEIRSERENDIHLQDFIQEMTSLSDRFGLTLIYEGLGQKEYFSMIKKMLQETKLDICEEEIEEKARIYALRHGRRSGRVAKQFVNQVLLENGSL